MVRMNTDVVIAGAGPVGLLLAGELRLAGLSVTVLERLTEPSTLLKAGGVHGRSGQVLGRRGLRPRIEEEVAKQGEQLGGFLRHRTGRGGGDGPPGTVVGHFGGMFLHVGPEFEAPPTILLPQQALERLLGAWVAELGVPVLRGHEITGFAQDADGVTVRATAGDEEVTVRGGFLVGCDGGRSTIRKSAGIDFPGTEPSVTGYQAIVALDHPDRLPPGWQTTDAGMYAYMPATGRVLTVEFDGPPSDRDAELTVREVQESLRRTSGENVTVTDMKSATRFTDNTRQAATYRAGRVLLAGDSAHVHPPFGGQGLNIGLQDAANLGWKLAATVQGWAPDGLLDTYTAERHPVAAQVLTHTLAQTAIMRTDARSRAMRELLGELLEAPGMQEQLVKRLHGLDVRYATGPGPAAHPLVGRHVPDLPGVEDAMRLPRPVLFDLSDSAKLRAAADGWTDRVDVHALPDASALTALLVRPDGHVVWAVEGEADDTDLDALREALAGWFGAPLR